MRCRASRLCSMPVSSCSFAWHSDSSATGTERARSGRWGIGYPLHPIYPFPSCSPAEQRSSPSLSFSQAFTLSRELARVERAGALPEGRIRVHWPCSRGEGAPPGLPSGAPCPDIALHRHPELSPTCVLVGVLPIGPPLGQGSGLSPW